MKINKNFNDNRVMRWGLKFLGDTLKKFFKNWKGFSKKFERNLRKI